MERGEEQDYQALMKQELILRQETEKKHLLTSDVSHVMVAALTGQFHLFLTFLEAGFLCMCMPVIAMRTADTLLEFVTRPVSALDTGV